MLSTLNTTCTFSGNDIVIDWTYTFQIFTTDGADIEIWLTSPAGVVSQVTTSYTIDVSTSTVTYPTVASLMDPLPTGWTLTLKRVESLTQLVDLVNQGSLDAESLENALDLGVAISQQLKQKITEITVTGATPAQVVELIAELGTLIDAATTASVSALASKNAAAISAAAALVSETNAAISALTIPAITGSDALKMIRVKADHSGYELSLDGSNLTDVDAVTLNGKVVGTSVGNIIALDGSAKLPAVDGSQLTGINITPTKDTLADDLLYKIGDDIAVITNVGGSTISGSYVKIAEIKSRFPRTLTLRISFSLAGSDYGEHHYARIYADGTPIGTERHTENVGASFTEDVAIPAGALIQIYAYKTGNVSTAVSVFKIWSAYDFQLSALAFVNTTV